MGRTSRASRKPCRPMTEPTCVQCGVIASEGYYDDRAEHYYCDDRCFEDWADNNFEEITDFYKRMNLG